MRNQRNNNNRAGTSYFDYSLLFIIIFLLGFGLVMLYSTSAYTSQLKFGSSTYYLYKQIFSSALGLVGLAMVSMLASMMISRQSKPHLSVRIVTARRDISIFRS